MMLKITMLKIMIIVMIIIMMMKTAILIINEDNNFKEGSDYINASWVPGFLSLTEFIMSQHPKVSIAIPMVFVNHILTW